MKLETIDTITRHLKGIVAALEKEKETGLHFRCDSTIPDDEIHFYQNGKLKGIITNMGQ